MSRVILTALFEQWLDDNYPWLEDEFGMKYDPLFFMRCWLMITKLNPIEDFPEIPISQRVFHDMIVVVFSSAHFSCHKKNKIP